ncbi:sigma-70 family RNA polymerase sigma factor [Pedobacter paludis]|uniref:RNA polymerase subunit sigma n=1 Tax=Pedobacter paludis TaxID=2203212 RepID=A0A317EWE7_9SPHI|nr:sigma-70 family RNA polymerase sigma factor [Pedobacter paludis]PWS30283.1 RNA polymerase subunit sigma [Pedobacter paludis]
MNNKQFAQVVEPYNTSLFSFAMKFTKDEDDANDLIQDTMVKAYRFFERFEEGSNLKGWLFTIMRNTYINDYRRLSRSNTLVTKTDEISSSNLAYSATHNQGEATFVMGDINGALAKLPIGLSKPFIRYVEGYKYHEIAVELNIPLGTVKTRIHEARKLLSKQLQMYKQRIS